MEEPNPLCAAEMSAFDALPERMKEFVRENGWAVNARDVVRLLPVFGEGAIISLVKSSMDDFIRRNPVCG